MGHTLRRMVLPAAVVCLTAAALPAFAQPAPRVARSLHNDTSPPLRDLVGEPLGQFVGEPQEINPLGSPSKVEGAISDGLTELPAGPVGPADSPQPLTSFQGISATGFLPPDTVGDVGLNHYVQSVNSAFAVFDKTTGALLLGPANINSLFAGFGGLCQSTNRGDPVVLYDDAADRWVISQFAFTSFPGDSEFHQCFAVSTSGDPTGSYNRYDFLWSMNKLNDYPKIGIWPEGYFMAVNQFDEITQDWRGQGVGAFERSRMLAGQSAQMVAFDLFAHDSDLGGMLPADYDGPVLTAGRPALYAEWDDANWIGPNDTVRIFYFDVDWTTPGNSTFGNALDPNTMVDTADVDPDMCGFARNCIPQPSPASSAQYVDAISDRTMQRMTFRDFGSYQMLLTNHTVDADGNDHAGIHWYEIRNPYELGGAVNIYQEAVWAPDSDHRWMGSAAMDGDGSIALGYSVSSTSTFPSIRYAVRLDGDPLGTLRGEQTAFAGAGVQQSGSGRWGDYSSMNVDPADDHFWYTQEFYLTNSSGGWRTGINGITAAPIFSDGFESGNTSRWN